MKSMSRRRVTRVTLHGQVIYPEELPCTRGNMFTKSSMTCITMMFAVCNADAFNSNNGEYVSFLIMLVCYLNLLIIAEIMVRLLHATEEMNHLKSRYKGSKWHLIRKLLNFTKSTVVFILVSTFSVLCIFLLKCDIEYHFFTLRWWKFAGLVIIGEILKFVVKLRKNPVYDSVFLETLRGLDYGSGMAQSFFYGYLRLCIPNTGDQEKGLEERINDFMAKEKISEKCFPVKKLFILIPSSTYIDNDLKDCSFDWMQSVGTLEKVVKDRAGCKGRPYKTSVYKIKDPRDDNDDGIYVVAEGATPCKTFHEVVQFSGTKQDFYKEHQKEIVFNFYKTLRETIWENRDCRDLCEIIYYVDTDEVGRTNVNVAQLILQRIREIEENEEYLRHVRERNVY